MSCWKKNNQFKSNLFNNLKNVLISKYVSHYPFKCDVTVLHNKIYYLYVIKQTASECTMISTCSTRKVIDTS